MSSRDRRESVQRCQDTWLKVSEDCHFEKLWLYRNGLYLESEGQVRGSLARYTVSKGPLGRPFGPDLGLLALRSLGGQNGRRELAFKSEC